MAGIFQDSWPAAAKADAIGEQQLKQTPLGSSSRRGRNRGAAVEADVIGEQRMQSGSRVEADAIIGEQQLKRMQSGSS